MYAAIKESSSSGRLVFPILFADVHNKKGKLFTRTGGDGYLSKLMCRNAIPWWTVIRSSSSCFNSFFYEEKYIVCWINHNVISTFLQQRRAFLVYDFLIVVFYRHFKKRFVMWSQLQQSEAVSKADCFKTCLSAGDDREASAANRNIVPIKMIIFPFKMLPLRKARLSQQTACLVLHDKTSLWMTNEGSFTPLHFTRLISDCVCWGQNSHLTLLMPSHGPVKRWTLSEMLPPHSGLLWMYNDCIAPLPCFHFQMERVWEQVPFSLEWLKILSFPMLRHLLFKAHEKNMQ